MGWLHWLRRSPPPAPTGAPRAPEAFEACRPLTDLPPDAVIGATYSPGFDPDLSGWRLLVSGDGCVRQEIRLSVAENHYSGESLVEEMYIGPEAAAALVTAAEVAGIRDMADRYDANCLDVETISVAVRFPDRLRTVVVDGALFLAAQGHMEAVAAFGLWTAVHRFAPWHPSWWPRRGPPRCAFVLPRAP